MLRRFATMLAGAALVTGAVAAAPASAADTPAPKAVAAPITLRVATLAPRESPWGKVFSVWQKGIKDETHGALELQFFYGNQQGDELAMVGKMRTRQLDGAAITATGLAQIYKDVLVLQLPGLYRDWHTLDAARTKMRPMLDAEFEKQGFRIIGWGDVGMAHLMTKGFDVRTPADLKHKSTFFLTGDPIEPMLYSLVGDVTPKQLTVPEILPALTAGTINVVNAPSLAAEQLQWSAHVDHVNTMASGIGIGALVMNKERLDGLPADVKAILERTGKNSGELLTKRIRGVDEKAFARMKESKTVVDPTETEKAAWQEVFKKVRNSLKAEGKIKADVFDEVTNAANN